MSVRKNSLKIINELDDAISNLRVYTRGYNEPIKIAISDPIEKALINKIFKEIDLFFRVIPDNESYQTLVGGEYRDCEFVIGYEKDFIVVFVNNYHFINNYEPIKINVYE